MNQTQINNFLKCLFEIDDLNYLALHARATSFKDLNNTTSLPGLQNKSEHQHDHDHDHEHDYVHDSTRTLDREYSGNEGLLIAKITAMTVLFCATLLCGSIPSFLNCCFNWTEKNADARSATVIKCLLYFGGGVLLATTFLHLLPEVQEVVGLLQDCEVLPELPFALAELLMCTGFFLMYFIEELIHSCMHQHRSLLDEETDASAAFERGHSLRNSFLMRGEGALKKTTEATIEPTAPPIIREEEEATTASDTDLGVVEPIVVGQAPLSSLSLHDLISHDIENQKYQAQIRSQPSSLMDAANTECVETENASPHHDRRHHQLVPCNGRPTPHCTNHYKHEKQAAHKPASGHSHTHLPSANNDEDAIATSLRGLFIVLALSLHELFEGMAIGLETSTGSVWFMFAAVSAHKLVLAFCVGVELIVARTRLSLCFIYMLTFALVSPIGIGIGIAISHSNDTASATIPSAVLQGLACGTLLYVVFFEILSKEQVGLGTYLALIVGFGVMFGLQQLGATSGGHSHGGCAGSEDAKMLLLNTTRDSNVSPSLYHTHQHHHCHKHEHEPNHENIHFAQELQILRQASENFMLNSKQKS